MPKIDFSERALAEGFKFGPPPVRSYQVPLPQPTTAEDRAEEVNEITSNVLASLLPEIQSVCNRLRDAASTERPMYAYELT
ncbi:hypothetical protein ACHAPT_001007 [Fusarium lateritium]